eukprot:CAMPEP_0194378692 /NCGR_PEP_ID=MMETSP0174-20130528/36938_1 /TAXON_ID=216777 /ORGANISM="Proboscia alata, Strain PI-D3" /LENGTH=136 /DNA_ID=CAMNT_0039160917 /DNA_START=65 /DNA_END=471 /DNA_ORIENTATION=-
MIMKLILISCFIGLSSFLPVFGETTTESERWSNTNNKDNINANDLLYGGEEEREVNRILSNEIGGTIIPIIALLFFTCVFISVIYRACTQHANSGGGGGRGKGRGAGGRGGMHGGVGVGGGVMNGGGFFGGSGDGG